jgi:hypothetical protein
VNSLLKAPGTQRLKLKYEAPPSNFAFNFNLRRYNSVTAGLVPALAHSTALSGRAAATAALSPSRAAATRRAPW